MSPTTFMVIKNDYLFPVPDRHASHLITWIEDKTAPNAVFLSYQDIFDPVILSGRKNYLGFFQEQFFLSKADQQRPDIVNEIYSATSSSSLQEGIARAPQIRYILIPLWKKPDFNYSVDQILLKKNFPTVYEDEKNLILKVR